MELGAHAHEHGFRHVHLDSVGSTNAECFERGQDRLWVTAGEQTAGRGRRGRAWASPQGNLHASVLLSDLVEPRRACELCFVTAVAMVDAVSAIAPKAAERLTLKWPNDLLVDGAKLAGILVEASHRGGAYRVVVGCGLNVAHHPLDTPYPAMHLAMTDPSARASGLFRRLSDSFALRLAEWNRGNGFASIRSAWLARAAGVGQRIIVRLPSGEVQGSFVALEEDGSLLLEEDDGSRRAISAGEVFFPAAQSGAL
jgi:BirA family transcriptional regulator, biotin operon repressor / biotin---[acetyl-CoA-carboxylase] ligase